MSKVVDAPRWTPPRPPVARTPRPATRAIQSVAETVVAASRPIATARERSRRLALRKPSERATRSSSSSSRPTRIAPPTTGDRRRDRAGLADRGLGLPGGLQVVGPGQAVGDQGRLEGDHAPPPASASATSGEITSMSGPVRGWIDGDPPRIRETARPDWPPRPVCPV